MILDVERERGMKTALRTLLAGAIDYAGTFPPAGLSLEQAAANYVKYRTAAHGWLLGRFVCQASQLALLETFGSFLQRGGGLSVLIDYSESIEQAAKSAVAQSLEAFELRSCSDLAILGDYVHNLFSYAADVGFSQATFYVEMPADAEPRRFAAALAGCNRRAATYGCRAGLKLRTGGTTPSAVPSAEQLAEVIVACRDDGLIWKATAGLHNPLRHFDSGLGAPMHGFINVLSADVLAKVHSLDQSQLITLLDDEDASHFRFTNDALSWRELSADVEHIAAARRSSFRLFGSCSFEEPVNDLHALGWL